MGQVTQSGAPVNLSSSGAVSLVPGSLIGFYVNSTSGGTVVVKDGGTSGTALNAAATPAIGWHSFPANCKASCFITISGTIDLTAFFQPG